MDSDRLLSDEQLICELSLSECVVGKTIMTFLDEPQPCLL